MKEFSTLDKKHKEKVKEFDNNTDLIENVKMK